MSTLRDKLWELGIWDDLTHDQHVELDKWLKERVSKIIQIIDRSGYIYGLDTNGVLWRATNIVTRRHVEFRWVKVIESPRFEDGHE